jgi:subtilisin family serine protease
MRRLFMGSMPALLVVGLISPVFAVEAAHSREYVVLYAAKASSTEPRTAIRDAGGRIVSQNRDVGLAEVVSTNRDFIKEVAASSALVGAAPNRPIGFASPEERPKRNDVERLDQQRTARRGMTADVSRAAASPPADPLAGLQWDMSMIHATADGSYSVQVGRRRVLVGIIDTGIDGTHPDIAPNFNRARSRNFTVDDPLIDGTCASDPDGSCHDPNNVDEDGHGTHVAGTVAAPLNGFGMAGVAPNVTLVNLRAGQDSGFFFLKPSVDALTYAGNIGVDVANMSYYIDPWLYNCRANPADSPEAQMEQSMIIRATQRALNYARNRGVTLIAAEGNEHTDLGTPTFDDTSPDYPPDAAYPRQVDNSCLDMPTEGVGVQAVSALGPSGNKADYSNYGVEQTTVSAPGGYFRDFYGTSQYMSPTNLVLAPYPAYDAAANGDLKPNGQPNNDFVVRYCTDERDPSTCAYYQYLQGTSMAAPHATGVASLIVSKYGSRDPAHPRGLTLAPRRTAAKLKASATDHPCPEPRLFTYPDRGAEYNATCEGTPEYNGFYGHGIVDALRAVTRG